MYEMIVNSMVVLLPWARAAAAGPGAVLLHAQEEI